MSSRAYLIAAVLMAGCSLDSLIEPIGAGSDARVVDVFGGDIGVRDVGSSESGSPESGPNDAGPSDSGADSRPRDSGSGDTGPADTGTPDTGPPDTGPPDTGPPDTGPPDTGPPDTGPSDTGPSDTGPPDTGPPDVGVVACDTLFASVVPEYEACGATADGCEFFSRPRGTQNCHNLCGLGGLRCTDSFGEESDLAQCTRTDSYGCDYAHNDGICVCSR